MIKKDFKNVIATFSLIGLMLIGGSYFYDRQVFAEKINFEKQQKQEQEKILEQQKAQQEERKLLAEKAILEEQLRIQQSKNEAAKQQAIFDAKQAEIARQKFQADLAAQQAAQQAAQLEAQRIANQKAVRQSSAS